MRDNFRSKFEAADDQYIRIKTATIVKDGTRGDVALNGLSPVRVMYPAGWKSTSPIVHVKVSEDGVTFYPLWTTASTAYTMPAVKSRAYQVSPDHFRGVTHIRLVGTQARGTAVTQGTICPISVVCRLI